ncbi:rho guanine nucleotide exchange factor 1-like isoform X2 [Anolis sagrei]|uniref:rho guanine nucleotide exchange factor 1-like isoform X2 n=1 Tax=Anolis sagrei TaxID=38937 RepID=UPI00352032CF
MELEEGFNGNPALGARSGSAMAIIGAEDEDFENDIEPFQNPEAQSGLFQSLKVLKSHPTYLMAFLQHVVLQFDSSPVLCSLHADLILNRLGPKEAKKQFVEFCHMFLDKAGLLRVPVPTAVQFELDRTRPELIPDDQQRKYLQEIQNFQDPEIARQLEDFREKRKMGMTPGESELFELESYRTKDRGIREAKQKQLAEFLLARLEEMHLTISADEEKSSAIFAAIVTYMKHLGVKSKAAENKKSKANFFRKKISGAKKPEEAAKPKKGFSILDPARWARPDSHYSDYRQAKPEGEAGEKCLPAPDRKGTKGPEGNPLRLKGGASSSSSSVSSSSSSGPDPPGICVSVHPPPPPSGEGGNEGEAAGADGQFGVDTGDSVVAEQPLTGDQPLPDDGMENESLEPPGGGGGGGDPSPQPSPLSFLPAQSEEAEPAPPPPSRSVPELEMEPPNWRDLVPPGTLLGLKKSQVKRQEVINELFITEHAHLRMLRVLLEVFYQPLLAEGFFSERDLANIFPSLEDLVDEHKVFLESLKKLREENNSIVSEIGSALLARFDGSEGNWFQKISARFCSRQSFALEQLKAKQKKEPRFNQFIQEAESQPQCRRLQLKDIIPIEMQRLTKYPLLLHNIAKCTEEDEERQKVEKAAECCRQILNHVNQEVRNMDNFLKLKDYQRRLDLSNLKQSTDPLLSEFRNTDITKKNLVCEGPLTWRLTKDKSIEVHVLLLDDILVLLQKQEERLVLKCHSRTITPTPDGKQMLSPIIKLNSAMIREVATDIRAFYVIFSWENGAQIYELVAQTVSERKNWCKMISDTAGVLKLPHSGRTKPRLSVPNRTSPPSPSYDPEGLLSGTENGGPLKEEEGLQAEEREKDGAEGTEFEERGGSAVLGRKRHLGKAMEEFLADILTLYKPRPAGQAALASAAQERVSALKRLLQIPEEGEGAFPADANNGPPENGAPHKEGEEEWEGAALPTEAEGGRRKPPGGSQDPPWVPEAPEKEAPPSPLVLSLQQSDGLNHHLRLLEDAVLGLKEIEEDYWRLQQLMGKLTSSSSSSSSSSSQPLSFT